MIVRVPAEELSKLQGYHTSLLKFLFRAEDDGNDVPTKVRLAVSSAERVKVSISVCRLVQSLQGDKVDEPISRITSVSQREAGSSDPSADVTQQVTSLQESYVLKHQILCATFPRPYMIVIPMYDSA